MKYTFTGAFAPFICGLIEKKQALGHDYHGSACILRTFDKFCREQFPHETCLTAELAMKWAEQSKTEKNLSRLNRVSVVRELAKYMNSVGEQAYLLPLQLTKKTGRHIPYIYSKEDLSKLFKEMDSLQPSLRSPTKHLVVSVIFRMIYCCGLRPVEARRLRREDVNLFDGTVNILESKGHKDRIVVLSEDMRELCRNYDQRVGLILPHFNRVHNATTRYDLVAANLLSGGFNMNYSRKNTISQQKNDGQSYSLGITQSSGLDHHAVYSRQRVDDFRENGVVSTQSARQHKDATDLVCQKAEAYAYLIRRLTPLECERLQGFPDGWTDIPDASDSARYKALGNSVAIPCVEFIMGRIAAALRAV